MGQRYRLGLCSLSYFGLDDNKTYSDKEIILAQASPTNISYGIGDKSYILIVHGIYEHGQYYINNEDEFTFHSINECTRLPNQDDYAIVYFGGIVEIRDGHKAQLEFLKSEDEDNDSSNFVHDFNVDLTLRSLEDDMFIS